MSLHGSGSSVHPRGLRAGTPGPCSDLAGPPLTPSPHTHIAFLLCWSNVGLIRTPWLRREPGKLCFLGLSFLVLACRVSVPSVACPLSGKKKEDRGTMGMKRRGHGCPCCPHLPQGWNPISGRKEVSSSSPGSSSSQPPPVAVSGQAA